MPRDDDDDTLETGTQTPKERSAPPAKPSRFHSRYLKDAERLEITAEEIEECKDNGELVSLIEHTRKSVADEERRSRHRQARREPAAQQAVSPPPPPAEKDPEYDPGEDLSHLDPAIRNQVIKLGNMLMKASSKGEKDRISERIEALEAENAALKQANSPNAKKGNRTLDKYPDIFGTKDDRDEDPNGVFSKRAGLVANYVMVTMQEDGSQSGDLEKDIHTAVAILFPGAKRAGKEAPPASQNGHQKPGENGTLKKSKADVWADAGDVPPTDRNGADRSGKPGGRKAAIEKVRAKRRELGHTAGDEDPHDDYDDDDDI